jgi:transketolase
MLTVEKKHTIQKRIRLIKKDIIEMIFKAQSGHPGGSLSLVEVLAVLYFHDLTYDIRDPKGIDRDRVVLSKGHAAPALYAVLAEAGFFGKEELWHYRQINSLLQGHPYLQIPGVDATTGSLGLGLSIACGMALAARMTGRKQIRVYAIMGDGELGEGQIWEAAMAAAHFQLDNLTAIIDRNNYQNDGATEDIMKLEPLKTKWDSFGWAVLEINGHNIDQIAAAFTFSRQIKGKPVMIIANTVKGNGASYLWNKPSLHYTPPTKEQLEQTILEIGL